MRKLISIKSFLVMLAFIAALSPLSTVTVSANHLTAAALVPVEIVPVCSDAATSKSYWEVNNKNSYDVAGSWTNFDIPANGTFTATPGLSSLVTDYDANHPNNRTEFTVGPDSFSRNATKAACAPVVVPPTPACIDGKIQQNLVITWLADDAILVTTKNDQPLCDDVEVYFSSYIMPANYDGTGFGPQNPTSFPQTIFSSVGATLLKNTLVAEAMVINLPDSCNNVQVDVYYGPEITTVGPNGHGTQNIVSDVYPSTGACPVAPGGGSGGGTTTPPVVTPPVTGGMGGGAPEAVIVPASAPVATPAVVTQPVPAVLPETGSNLIAWLIVLPLLVGAVSYKSALAFLTRRNFTIAS